MLETIRRIISSLPSLLGNHFPLLAVLIAMVTSEEVVDIPVDVCVGTSRLCSTWVTISALHRLQFILGKTEGLFSGKLGLFGVGVFWVLKGEKRRPQCLRSFQPSLGAMLIASIGCCAPIAKYHKLF